MTQPSDFEENPIPSQSKSSVHRILWIFGCLGCGFLGFIFLGIIAAIALPSFLSKANKARQAEARTFVGAMTRAQQAYHLEKGTFSNSIEGLGIGIRPETENYRYQIVSQPNNQNVMITAQAKRQSLKSYTGAVFAIKKGETVTTITGICETDNPTTTAPTMPKLTSNGLQSVECPPGSQSVQ
jgi:type II secretory pathway pseudopilin PulG